MCSLLRIALTVTKSSSSYLETSRSTPPNQLLNTSDYFDLTVNTTRVPESPVKTAALIHFSAREPPSNTSKRHATGCLTFVAPRNIIVGPMPNSVLPRIQRLRTRFSIPPANIKLTSEYDSTTNSPMKNRRSHIHFPTREPPSNPATPSKVTADRRQQQQPDGCPRLQALC